MQREGKIQDFNSFVELAGKASKFTKVLPMDVSSFRPFKNLNSNIVLKRNAPNFTISLTVAAEFRKGSRTVFVSYSHTQKEPKEIDFLRKRMVCLPPNPCTIPRGLNKAKNERILSEILPSLDVQYHGFWQNIPQSELSEDLLKLAHLG